MYIYKCLKFLEASENFRSITLNVFLCNDILVVLLILQNDKYISSGELFPK